MHIGSDLGTSASILFDVICRQQGPRGPGWSMLSTRGTDRPSKTLFVLVWVCPTLRRLLLFSSQLRPLSARIDMSEILGQRYRRLSMSINFLKGTPSYIPTVRRRTIRGRGGKCNNSFSDSMDSAPSPKAYHQRYRVQRTLENQSWSVCSGGPCNYRYRRTKGH